MYQIRIGCPMPLQMGGRYTQAHGWEHAGRTLERSFLFSLEQGSCSFTVGKTRMEFTPGDMLIVPRNTFYAPTTQSGCTYVYLHFDAEIEPAAEALSAPLYRYRDLMKTGPAVFRVPERFQADSAALLLLETILGELTRPAPTSQLKMNLAFLQLLLHLSEKAAGQTGRTLAHEMEAYMQEHLHQPLSLDSLAQAFGYTKQYIIRVFRAQFGMPPMAYLNEARLSHALRCLMETSLCIEEVARRSGFEDSNYFSRLFKKKYQLPPSVYRRQAAGI